MQRVLLALIAIGALSVPAHGQSPTRWEGKEIAGYAAAQARQSDGIGSLHETILSFICFPGRGVTLFVGKTGLNPVPMEGAEDGRFIRIWMRFQNGQGQIYNATELGLSAAFLAFKTDQAGYEVIVPDDEQPKLMKALADYSAALLIFTDGDTDNSSAERIDATVHKVTMQLNGSGKALRKVRQCK